MQKKLIPIIVLTLIFISGCTSSSGPQKTLDDFMSSAKSGKIQKLKKLTSTQEFGDDDMPEFFDDVFASMSYKIIDSKINDDKATFTLDITNIDMSLVLADIATTALTDAFAGKNVDSDDYMSKLFGKTVKKFKGKDITTNVSVDLSKSDDKWLVETNDDLLNAMTGGVLDAVNIFNDQPDDDILDFDSELYALTFKKYKKGETVTFETVDLTILEAIETKKLKTFDENIIADRGTKFVKVKATVKNITKDTLELTSTPLLVDDKDRNYETFLDYDNDDSLEYNTLSPDVLKTGYFVYQIPEDAQNYFLEAMGVDGEILQLLCK